MRELGDIRQEQLSEARLRQLVAHLPYYAVLIDREHRHVWVNRVDETLDLAHVIGQTVESFCHVSCRAHVSEQLDAAFKTQRAGYYEARAYGDGEMETWYGVRVVPLPPDDFGRARALLLSADVTQRRNAEEALRQSEARFRMLTEASPDFVIVLDQHGRCEYVNREPRDVPHIPLRRHSMLGRRIDEFVRAEERPQVLQSLRRVLDTGNAASFDTQGLYSGRSYVNRLLPLPGTDGERRALLVTTDVSEQRAAEEHRLTLEARLAQAQKMESIGQLAGGVAHDFNNMIMIMSLHLEAAREFARSGQHDQTCRELDAIEAAGKRAAELTRQLLTFARRQPHSPRAVRAADFTASAVRLLSRLIPASIRLELDVLAQDAWVTADPGLIEQVLMNLCVNARDAIGDRGGTIRVQLARQTIEDGGGTQVPAGHYVTLSVADDGSGIDTADLPRIFEPFYTTKPTGQGTGLGLSMVHGIVTQHQGFVTVDSSVGKGSVLTVYLPEVKGESQRSEPPAAAEPRAQARGRILIVEDEPTLRRLLAKLLRRAGHAVVEAENGERALRAVKASSEPFDLMVLDAVMPEMGGKECFERVQELQPGLPAIFSSGYAGDQLPSAFLREHDLQVVAKPYDSKTLLDAVDSLLRRRARRADRVS